MSDKEVLDRFYQRSLDHYAALRSFAVHRQATARAMLDAATAEIEAVDAMMDTIRELQREGDITP